MTLPWQSSTTPEISAEVDSRYETPGGAQNKVNVSQDYLLHLLKLAVTGLSDGSEAAIARYSTPYDVTYDWLKDRLDAADQRFINRRIFNAEDYGVFDGITDNAAAVTSAIAAMPSTGGILLIPATCILNTTVTVNKTLTIMGNGFTSVIKGSANPLITTDTNTDHKINIENCKIVTTGSNNGVYINKTWNAGAIPSFKLQNVWFHSEGNAGSLLKIYGSRESAVTNCIFTAGLSWIGPFGTAVGIELVGDTSGGAMNLHFTSCIFANIYRGVYGTGATTRADLFAGFHFSNCEMIACYTGAEFSNGGVFDFTGGMFDFCRNPIVLRYWGGANIGGNYISTKEETDIAIKIIGENGNSEEINIHHNGIYTYGDYTSETMTSIGVLLDASSGSGGVSKVKIDHNNMRNFDHAVKTVGFSFSIPAFAISTENNNIGYCKNGATYTVYTVNSRIQNNNFDGVTTPITNNGARTIVSRNRKDDMFGYVAEEYETVSTAATYSYAIPHGLYASPKYAIVVASSTQTRDAGTFSTSWDATNIYVNFSTPTSAGLALKFSYIAEV